MGRLFGGDDRRADEQWLARVEGDTLAFDFCRRMAKPEMAHRPHATRQDVAQVAFDELRAFEGLDARGVDDGGGHPRVD